jgi:hypothetical protein
MKHLHRSIGMATMWMMIILPQMVQAQLNVKVAYNAQYTPFKQTNAIFNLYNTEHPTASEAFGNFHFMHGLDLGARYMLTPTLGAEASIATHFTGDNATSAIINEKVTSDEWRLSQRYISLGLESYHGSIGFGAHIGKAKWKYLSDVAGASKKQNLHEADNYSLKLNFTIQVKSAGSAFALKPYYILPLSENDISPVNKTLNSRDGQNKEKLDAFGISIVFYNGRQSE